MKQSIEQIADLAAQTFSNVKKCAKKSLIASLITAQIIGTTLAAPVSKKFTYHADPLYSANRNLGRYEEPVLTKEKGDPNIVSIGDYSTISSSGKDDEDPIEVEIASEKDCVEISYRITNTRKVDKNLSRTGQILAVDAVDPRIYLILPAGVNPKLDEMTQVLRVIDNQSGKEDMLQTVPKNRTDLYIACSVFNALQSEESIDPEKVFSPELSETNNEIEKTFDFLMGEYAGESLKWVMEKSEKFVRWQQKKELQAVEKRYPGRKVYLVSEHEPQSMAAVYRYSKIGTRISIPLENLLEVSSRANIAVRDLDFTTQASSPETKSIESLDYSLLLPPGKEQKKIFGRWEYAFHPVPTKLEEYFRKQGGNSKPFEVYITPKQITATVGNEKIVEDIVSIDIKNGVISIETKEGFKPLEIISLGPDAFYFDEFDSILAREGRKHQGRTLPDLETFVGEYREDNPKYNETEKIFIRKSEILVDSGKMQDRITLTSPFKEISKEVYVAEGVWKTTIPDRELPSEEAQIAITRNGSEIFLVSPFYSGALKTPDTDSKKETSSGVGAR